MYVGERDLKKSSLQYYMSYLLTEIISRSVSDFFSFIIFLIGPIKFTYTYPLGHCILLNIHFPKISISITFY